MRRYVVTHAIALAIASCADSDEGDWYRSPSGYRLRVDHRGRMDALDYSIVDTAAWLDLRIKEWIASHSERNPDELRAIASSARFGLIDDWRFASRASPTGFAAGQTLIPTRYVEACVWNSATWKPPEPGLIVISHEMDHLLGIGHE